MKKLVFIDFDGTIYNNKTDSILPSTVEAIKELSKKEDIILGLATGRSLDTLTKIKDILPLFKIKVLINGSIAYFENNLIFKNPIKKETSTRLCKYLLKNDINYGMVTLNDTIIAKYDTQAIEAFKEFGLPLPNRFQVEIEEDIYQFWVFSSKIPSNKLAEEFEDLQFIDWNFEGMDVLDKNGSKGDGIRAAKKYIEHDLIYVFGDGLNDIDMFKEADFSIAMGQARDKVKENATYVTDTIENDGLVKGLKHYKLI